MSLLLCLAGAEILGNDQGNPTPPGVAGARGDIKPPHPGVRGTFPPVHSGVRGTPSFPCDPIAPPSSRPTSVGRFLIGRGMGGEERRVDLRIGILGRGRGVLAGLNVSRDASAVGVKRSILVGLVTAAVDGGVGSTLSSDGA